MPADDVPMEIYRTSYGRDADVTICHFDARLNINEVTVRLGGTSDMLGTLRRTTTAEPLPLLGMPADDVTMEVYTLALNERRSQTPSNIVAKFDKFYRSTRPWEARRHFRHARHIETNKCAKFREYRSNTLPPATRESLPLLGMPADKTGDKAHPSNDADLAVIGRHMAVPLTSEALTLTPSLTSMTLMGKPATWHVCRAHRDPPNIVGPVVIGRYMDVTLTSSVATLTPWEARRHIRHARHIETNKCAKFRDYRSKTSPPATAEPLPL
ncbi:hypothetical protein DPMN_032021 [Dreissena polymorpha]|uniref:Uncharacterized protein n=1 Tax=Dreissena polymorpha TaxID=45954 RepID=A0A9D4M100_DREPO|nr:hypothetical protein DPMN_032021 [Dreissena polymorpha]